MRLIRSAVFSLALMVTWAAVAAPAGAATDVTAILVTASRQAGESDGRLAAYESTLRRILRFESYGFVGQGRATVPDDGEAVVSLGAGQSLALAADGDQLAVTWRQGGRTLMRTGLVLRPGVPAVLGGPGTGKDGEVYAVIVTTR